jgi:hypothetical protein
MRSATLVKALTALTTAMAVAAPVVVFGFLYVLQVHPERAAVVELRNQLAAARDELNRRRSLVGPRFAVKEASALDEFDARATNATRVGEMADAVTAILNSRAVGGVSNLSIESGAPGDGPVAYMPVTVTFDARYAQIGRFFWNLRMLPTAFDLQSVELTPLTASRGGLTRAKVSLLVFQRLETAGPRQASRTHVVDVITPPEWVRDPFAKPALPGADRIASAVQPDPVVSSILFSNGRRVALVDGQVVRRGDRVRAGVVLSIEVDAVVIADPQGRARRFEIKRPVIRSTQR